MRSVSYVQCVALDFAGSLFPHAICLGDADNDTVRAPRAGWGGRGPAGGARGAGMGLRGSGWGGPRAGGAGRSWRGFQPWGHTPA